MMNQKDRERRFPPLLYWSCCVIITTLLIVVISDQKLNGCHWYSSELVFSTLTLVVSTLAFCGAITALLLQSQELGLQRKELAETRKELQRQAEAQEKTLDQLKADGIQSRLGTLFQQFLSIYSLSAPNRADLVFFNASLGFTVNEKIDTEWIKKSTNFFHGLHQLNVFCELALSNDYAGNELDRKVFATIVTAKISDTEKTFLATIAALAASEFMSLIELLYVYSDLEVHIHTDPRKMAAKNNIELFAKHRSLKYY